MRNSTRVLWTVVFLTLFSRFKCNFNLYMDDRETFKLLGITAELYYVRGGIINDYALGFSIPIPADINRIHFLWESLREAPPEPAMYYNMAFYVSNLQAMHRPSANISKEGVVPTSLTEFAILLQCTGLMTAEVEVRIQMNITIFSASNVTVLDIKRRKFCTKDNGNKYSGKELPTNVNIGLHNNSAWGSKLETADDDILTPASTNIFYIAVGCACAVILIIALSVGMYYIQTRKRRRNGDILSRHILDSNQSSTNQGSVFLRVDTPNNASTTGLSVVSQQRRSWLHVQEIKPAEVQMALKQIHVDRNNISLGEVLYEGTFGRIYQGILIGSDENHVGSEQTVFIKSVSDQARSDQIQRMLVEGSLLMGLCHVNINPVFAACLDNESQPYLVFPYSNEGLLKKFLLRCKMSDLGAHQGLNTQQLVNMALQVIRGLQYLHRKRIVHRDVATRNCVIDSQFTVKIVDNALSRDLFPNDYHCLGDNENRPVKWMALEALLDKRFSPASDVWSFGVLLWELMTLGSQPYAEIDPFEIESYLREGYRIMQPVNCPDELFAVMACCWALSPEERPKFSQLLVCLQDFHTALGRFI